MAAQIRAFVPVQTKPLEIGNELIFKTSFAAFDISVFDAQHHGAALPRAKSQLNRAVRRIAHVEMPSRRGRKNEPGQKNLKSRKRC